MMTTVEKIGRIQINKNLPGQAIGKLISSDAYVLEDTPIEELLALFQNSNEKIPAIAVVDENLQGKGAIVRKELVSLLSRPFGREVMKKRPVSKVSAQTRSFLQSAHIFSVSDELDEVIKSGTDEFFLLHDREGRFQGLFSTQDLMIYLSNLTQKDITLAHNLQTRMVKERLSVLTADLEVSGSASTAKGVGGDFYSVKKISSKDWILSLCDVSGKGVAASIITAMLYGIIETFEFRRGLTEFVRQLNHSIFSTFNAEKYLTGVFLMFDESKAKMKLLDMGHSFVTLIRDGRVHSIASSDANLPVGITPAIDPQVAGITLVRGDILLLITDGLTEQQNQSGEEYPLKRLYTILTKHSTESLEELRERILADFHSFKQDTPYHDDVTFMLIRYPHEEEFDEDIEWEKVD
jgi:phosphoserine phosphatase RsbU/P